MSGSGYQFSPEDFPAVHAQWQDVREQLYSTPADAAPMENVHSAGNDQVSAMYNTAAQKSHQAYINRVNAASSYASQYTEALSTAGRNYDLAEANVQAGFSNT